MVAIFGPDAGGSARGRPRRPFILFILSLRSKPLKVYLSWAAIFSAHFILSLRSKPPLILVVAIYRAAPEAGRSAYPGLAP